VKGKGRKVMSRHRKLASDRRAKENSRLREGWVSRSDYEVTGKAISGPGMNDARTGRLNAISSRNIRRDSGRKKERRTRRRNEAVHQPTKEEG